jgi:anti-sigma factor RsiW
MTPFRRNPDPRSSVGKDEPHTEKDPTMGTSTSHPESTRLEAFAAGDLASHEARGVEVHLADCARCRAEVEGWATLFAELGELPPAAPSPDFAARVMAQVEIRPPLARRLADQAWGAARGLRARLLPAPRRDSGAPDPGTRHLTPAGMQDYADGLLAARTRHRVEAHLATCRSCREETRSWTALVGSLQTLPRLAPPEGFADRVMAQVQVEAVARVSAHLATRPSAPVRLLQAAGRLLPSTRRGWIVAGGVAMAPTLGVIAAVSAVVLNPLVTLSDLLTFLRWQTLDLVRGAGAALAARLADTPILLRLAEGVAALVEAPPAALGGAVFLVVALLATASLVVYRNLIAPSLTGETHAQRTS